MRSSATCKLSRYPPLLSVLSEARRDKAATRALCHGRKAYLPLYTFTDGTTVRLALYPSRVPGNTAKCRLKWLASVIVRMNWSPKKVYQRYRRRFGIESSYRQLGRLRAHATSRNPALHFFPLGLALLLINVWVHLRWLVTRLPIVGPAQLDLERFRLHRSFVFLRRPIEHAFPSLDTIAVYSW